MGTSVLASVPDPDMTDASSRYACPACGGSLRDVFDGGELPVNVGIFPATREAALAAPRGRILLAHCATCGIVHNRAFDPDGRIFAPGYEVALHHSETFRTFIETLALRLRDRFALDGKRIVEIGCGDGYLLKRLAALGANDCVGIDPTIARPGTVDVEAGRVRLVRDWFGPDHAEYAADFACCLSVFEDIPRPGPFLLAARRLVGERNAPLYLEVFNGWRAFEAGEVWSVHYEQCNYFSLDSLTRVLGRHGFRVEDAGTCYGGDQYLYVEARADRPTELQDDAQADVPETLPTFARRFDEQRDAWNRTLRDWRERGERVVAWGTGGKGITFLNTVDSRDIAVVAEINPDKQGRHVPGTGQLIVAPDALVEYQPDRIIVTNALYRPEMEAQARALGLHAEFHVA